LRKYDCTKVQFASPQAEIIDPARFSTNGERANLPFDSEQFLVRPILNIIQ